MLLVATRWAEAARAQSIYPPGHHRVKAAHEALAGALPEARRRAGSEALEVAFTGTGVQVQGLEVPLAADAGAKESGLAWLRERLEHAGLAGIAIAPEATGASLAALDERLLALFAQREPVTDVTAAWGEGGWAGITLLDRRFEGGFEGEAVPTRPDQLAEARARLRTWGGRGVTLRSDERNQPLVQGLMADRGLVERVHKVADAAESRVREGTLPGDRPSPQEVLDHLATLLPPGVQDPKDAAKVIAKLVEALEAHHVGEGPGTRGPLDDADLSRRAAWLVSVLANADAQRKPRPAQGAQAPQGPQGHAGDERYDDDPVAFAAEFAALPRDGEVPPLESTSEHLGVMLHMLTRHEDPARLVLLVPTLQALLAQADAARLGVLRSVADAAAHAALAGDGGALRRLLQAFKSSGLAPYLRACGFLGRERVLDSFPALFGEWAATLRLGDAHDRDELQQVLRELGDARLVQHADAVLAGLQAARPGMLESLLALPLTALAPLVNLALERIETAVREPAVAWLRSVRPQEPAAQVLEIVEEPVRLPLALLRGLVGSVMGRPLPEGAQQDAVHALAEFVQASAARPDRRARRLDALRLLGAFALPEATEVLQGILGGRRWLLLPAEDSLTREVAAEALKRQGVA
ncbi:MAG: hypothetical protein ACKOSS_05845 [Planctomycetia bacterium]